MRKNNRKGFTIVELVIVIAVIAILAAVLIPTFGGIVSKANKSAREQEVSAALKSMLVAENGKFDTDNYTYTFILVDENDVYAYEYVNGKLGAEAKATAKELTANDIAYTDDGTFTAIGETIKAAADVTVKAEKVEDLGEIVVLKIKK